MCKIYKIIIKTYQGVGLIFNNTRIVFGFVTEYRSENGISIRDFQGVDLDLTGGEHRGTSGL